MYLRFILVVLGLSTVSCRAVLGIDPAPHPQSQLDGGVMPECARDEDCPGSTDCVHRTCKDLVCKSENVAANTPCGDGKTCTGSGECAECVPGSAACVKDDPGQRRVCSSKGAWETSPCARACLGDRCVDCTPGSKECTGDGKLRECGPSGSWGEPAACDPGMCLEGKCTACVARVTRCTGGKLQVCSDQGEWGESRACVDKACLDNMCMGVCSPGSKRCADGTSVEVCSERGEWGAAMKCPYACVQSDETKQQDCGGVCVPDTDQCAGGTAQHCGAKGTWDAPQSCSPGDCGSDNRCTSCMPGKSECVGSQRRVCLAQGTWGPLEACDNGCDGGACKPCKGGDVACLDAKQVHTCKPEGQWGDPVPCGLGCDQAKCRACSPGAVQCDPNAPDWIRMCNANGQWQESTRCSGTCDASMNRCVECLQGMVTCPEETTVKRCLPDGTAFQEPCRDHSTCVPRSVDYCPCDPGYHPGTGPCVPNTPGTADAG